MKLNFITLSLISLGFTAYSQTYFKGTISAIQNDQTAKDQKVVWHTNSTDNYLLTHVGQYEVAVLATPGKLSILFPADHSYIDQGQTAVSPFLNTSWEGSKVAKTGKNETINGKVCNEILVSNKDYKASIWLSDETILLKEFTPSSPLQEVYKNKFTGLPYKIEVLDNAGQIVLSNSITAIDYNKFDAKLFHIPASYKPTTLTVK